MMLALLFWSSAVGLVVSHLRERPVLMGGIIALASAPLLFGAWTTLAIVNAFLLLLMLVQPLFVLLTAVTWLCFEKASDVPPENYGIFAEKIFELTDKNVLLAIPFFVIAGSIMTHGGIAKRLIALSQAWTAWLPGGVAVAAVGGCVLFAAMSGSSPVTVIAIGSMMYPTLAKSAIGERGAVGLLTSAGSLGIVIPPSIPMLVYAIVVSGSQVVDVGDLFMAGIGPGALLGSLLVAVIVFKALLTSRERSADVRRLLVGFGVLSAPAVFGLVVSTYWVYGWTLAGAVWVLIAAYVGRRQLLDSWWALLLPFLILGGIRSGACTPTQAAAVAVVYALLVSVFVYRELEWTALPKIVGDATVMIGALIAIMVIAFVFNDYLVEEQVPDRAVALLQSWDLTRWQFLLGLNVLLLITGCFMDILSAILLIAPLLAPMASALNVDPLHLGIIFIVNLEIGYLTPPLGLNLFVASTLFKKPLGEVITATLPFTAIMLAGVLLITYVPSIALAPVRWSSQQRSETSAETEGIPEEKVLSIEELMQLADDDEEEEEEDDE